MTNTKEISKKYAYTRKINSTFYETLDDLRFALSDLWFWIVSTIDVWQKIVTKVDSSFWNYIIFWVCNPEIAYRFLKHNLEYWVFMPCTITVYEKKWAVHISAWLPDVMLYWVVNDENIKLVSEEVTKLLIKVIDNV